MKERFIRRQMSQRHAAYTGMIGGTIVVVGLLFLQYADVPFWAYLLIVFVGIAITTPLFKRWEGSRWDGTGTEYDRTL